MTAPGTSLEQLIHRARDGDEQALGELCERYRRDDGRPDCIMSGSGGKDSFYAAHVLKHKYGMHPLTVTYAPHIYTDWGRKNHEAWIQSGFDNLLMTPNGRKCVDPTNHDAGVNPGSATHAIYKFRSAPPLAEEDYQ